MKNVMKPTDVQKQSPNASWRSVFRQSWQSVLAVNRSQITLLRAGKSVVGFVLPLALGIATGHVDQGVAMAGGAATLGAVGLTYTYRAHTRTLLLACFAIAFSGFIGSLIGRDDVLTILILGLWGFGAGIAASISLEGQAISVQAVAAMIVLTHFALDPLHALLQALLLLAGALFQTLLAAIPFPRQRATPERAALATAYQSLAAYASNTGNDEQRVAVSSALLQAYNALADVSTTSMEGIRLRALYEEVERIRLLLIVITRLQRALPTGEMKKYYGGLIEQFLGASSAVLQQVATNVMLASRRMTLPLSAFKHLDEVYAGFEQQDKVDVREDDVQQLLTYCHHLCEQLYVVKRLVEARHGIPQEALQTAFSVQRRPYLRLRDNWQTLRANLTLDSVYFRHGLRLGLALAFATALYRLTPLPIARGYWISLTILLVLRTDLISTFTRGIARLLGTLLGVLLAAIMLALFAPYWPIIVLFDAIAAFIAYAFLIANYAIFSIFITIEVILLLAFVLPQPFDTALSRGLDTLIGGLIALLIYAIWPTMERTQVLNTLVKRIDTQRIYIVSILHAFGQPAKDDLQHIEELHMKSNVAYSNAQASVKRALQEPETRPTASQTELAEGLLSATNLLSQSALSLEAFLVDNPLRHGLPEILPFAKTVNEALHILATNVDIDSMHPLQDLPDVQGALDALEQVDAAPNPSSISLRFLKAEASNIARGIDAMQQLLATKEQVPGSRHT